LILVANVDDKREGEGDVPRSKMPL